jgi:hypothetical protein
MAPAPLSGADLELEVPTPNATHALKDALAVLDKKSLLDLLLKIVEDNLIVQRTLENKILVRGKDVVRYHVDTDSEDRGSDEEESDAEESDDERPKYKERQPIAIKDHEATGRIAICLNCNSQFNVTENEKGDCLWHTGILISLKYFDSMPSSIIGEKELYHDDDYWADHDPNCHGDPESFIDDDDFAEGFQWTCCDQPGDNNGCKSTKHKAAVNIIIVDELPEAMTGRKRKADEELPNPRI